MIAPLMFALGLLLTPATAITTPESAEMRRIQGLLDSAKRAEDVYQTTLKRLREGRASESDAAVDRDARTRAWTIAMHQTLIAYGMAFPDPDNKDLARLPAAEMQSGTHAGKVRPWVLTFSDLPLDQIIVNSRSVRDFAEWQNHRREANAVTLFDGTTVVFANDFTKPAHLARTLFHELRHFQQLADPKFKGSTLPEREVDAYKQVLGNIGKFGFNPNTSELTNQRKYAAEMIVKKEREAITERGRRNLGGVRGALNRLFGREQDLSGYEESTLDGVMVSKEAIEAIREEAGRIRRQLDVEAEERRERAEREREATHRSEAERDEEERRREALDRLKQIAERVCAIESVRLAFHGDVLADWARWRSDHFDFLVPLPSPFDSSHNPTGHFCADYIVNQVQVARGAVRAGRLGSDALDFYWLSGQLRRHQEAARQLAPPGLRPAPPSPRPAPPAAAPKPPPPAAVDDSPEVIDELGAQPPDRPHCKYQGDWCR